MTELLYGLRSDLMCALSATDSIYTFLDIISERSGLAIGLLGFDSRWLHVTEAFSRLSDKPTLSLDELFNLNGPNSSDKFVSEGSFHYFQLSAEANGSYICLVFSNDLQDHKSDYFEFGVLLTQACAFLIDESAGFEPAPLAKFDDIIIARTLLDPNSNVEFKSVKNTLANRLSKFKPFFRIAIFASEDDPESSVSNSCARAVHQFFPSSFYLKKESRLIVFVYNLEESIDSGTFMESANNFCRAYRLRVSISSPFYNTDIRFEYLRQAEILSSVPFKEGTCVQFAEEHFTEIALLGSVSGLDHEFSIRSDIKALAQYDVENGTKYLDTLEKYFASSNHLTNAANALFIDRGTLKYRLEKIQKIIHEDIEDPKISQNLYLGILVFRWFEANKK